MANQKEPDFISIAAPQRSVIEVTIKGDEPLLVHRFGEKARKQLAESDQKTGAEAKKKAREKRDIAAEYLEAFYLIDKKNIHRSFSGVRPNRDIPEKDRLYGIPATGIKSAMVTAGSHQGFFKTRLKPAFYVKGDHGELSAIRGSEPFMREDIVRLSGPSRAPQLRYRPQFDEWEATFVITFDPNVIDQESIINLLAIAGYSIGLFEWRPEKGGTFGIFHVANVRTFGTTATKTTTAKTTKRKAKA